MIIPLTSFRLNSWMTPSAAARQARLRHQEREELAFRREAADDRSIPGPAPPAGPRVVPTARPPQTSRLRPRGGTPGNTGWRKSAALFGGFARCSALGLPRRQTNPLLGRSCLPAPLSHPYAGVMHPRHDEALHCRLQEPRVLLPPRAAVCSALQKSLPCPHWLGPRRALAARPAASAADYSTFAQGASWTAARETNWVRGDLGRACVWRTRADRVSRERA